MSSPMFHFLFLIFTNTILDAVDLPLDSKLNLYSSYCKDAPLLQIDHVRKDSDSLEVYFKDDGNTWYKSKGKPRTDASPNITLLASIDKQPSHLDISIDNYIFLKDLNAYLLKSAKKWRFIGFNQDWLTCPQALCLNPRMDAAVTNEGKHWFFRGYHYWVKPSIPVSPLVNESQRLTRLTAYFDAGVAMKGDFVFVKDEKLYNLTTIITDEEADHGVRFVINSCNMKKVNAAFFGGDEFSGDEFSIILLEQKHYCYSSKGDWKTARLTEKLHELDAAFTVGSKVYLMKGWHYFEGDKKNFDQNAVKGPHSVFNDIFKCDDSFYEKAGFVDRQQFEKTMIPGWKGKTIEEWSKMKRVPYESTTATTVTTTASKKAAPGNSSDTDTKTVTETNEAPVLAALLIICFGISAICFIGVIAVVAVFYKKDSKRKGKKRGSKSSSIESQTGSKVDSKVISSALENKKRPSKAQKGRSKSKSRSKHEESSAIASEPIETIVLFKAPNLDTKPRPIWENWKYGTILTDSFTLDEKDIDRISPTLLAMVRVKRENIRVGDKIVFSNGRPEYVPRSKASNISMAQY